jgi:beta-N-acetylhexosaminidase
MMTAMPNDRVSRRDVLRLAGWGSVAVGLAACGPAATPSPIRSPSPPPTAEPTSPVPSTSPSPAPSASPEVSLEAKVARLFVVGFRGTALSDADWVASAIADRGLGGVILFDRGQETGGRRNIRSPAQLRRLAGDLRDLATDRTLLVAIDQEGGRVARLSPATGFPEFASQADVAAQDDPHAITEWAESIATTLADAGVNFNLAPVVDLNANPSNPAIGALDRSFSADPAVVTQDARLEIAAHRAAGVRTTLKHFPGLGSAATNTDFGIADVTDTWSRRELEPFQALIDGGHADSIMVGHVINGQIEPDVPASLSVETVSGLLRGELGWEGVVITDDLQAAAITEQFGRDEAIALALEAGCDLLLFANQQVYDPDIVDRVVELVGGLVDDGRLDEGPIDESFARVRAFSS